MPVETSPPSIQPVKASTKVARSSNGDSWIFRISLSLIIAAPARSSEVYLAAPAASALIAKDGDCRM